MTLRLRRPERGIRTRLGRMVDSEERRQGLITAAFIAAIGLVVMILVGAFALAWYNDNVRPLARVGSVEVGPQLVRDYIRLEQFRIARDENRVTQAQINGDMDADEAQAKLAELNQREESLPAVAVNNYVDLLYQSQLAPGEGITVGDEQVNALYTDEMAALEQRHVLSITVEAQAADEEAGPTTAERQAALDRATEALAELQGGADWADVAREFGTDPTSQAGGDLGVVTELNVGDGRLAEKVFELESGGTTGVVLGEDGSYRIGRVLEIIPAGEEPGLRSRLHANLTEEAIKRVLSLEATSAALEDRVVTQALAQTPEQIRLAVIYIAGLSTGDADEAEGEIQYSEIVFAPNDNIEAAPDLPGDDPAWAEAEAEARAAFAELQAITDIEERKTAFAEMAPGQSDSPTGEDGGDAGFVTRSIPPVAVSDALWDGEHAEGDLIGPVRADAGWYVLLFQEKRESVETRLQEVRDALAAPDADFAAIAEELSDGPQAEDGGNAGWFTQSGLEQTSTPEFAQAVFALQAGQVSDALELGEGHYFAKALERMVRPFDADQVPGIEQTAFDDWYGPKREEAETNGTIVVPGTTDAPDDLEDLEGVEGGEDQP